MKSIFLATLLGALVSSAALAQTAKKKKLIDPPANPRATQVSSMPVAAKADTGNKTSFDRFYDRLSIGYFGFYQSSPLGFMHADFAATSPETETKNLPGCRNNCDNYPQNIFNQVTFGYDFGGGNKFIIVPRFTLFLGKARGVEESPLFNIDDALVGFSRSLYASADKKFAWNIRPAVRLPTSRASRTGDAPGFGDLTLQPDISTSLSYTMNENISMGYNLQNRFWVYEDRFNESQHRIAQSIYLNQKLTDKMALSYNFEYWVQNSRNRPSINGKGAFYNNIWQNFYVSLPIDITPKMNFAPTLGGYVNDPQGFGLDSMYLTASMAYSFK